jgi:hypothetical protein
MELTIGSSDMQNEVEKMATTFLDQIGLQMFEDNRNN